MHRPLSRTTHVGLVAAGSAVGALARALLTEVVQGPWSVLWAVNLVGALLLGLLTTLLADRSRPWLLPLLGPGLLGGFTTFSAVTVLVATSADALPAAGQLLAMTVLGVLAAALGLRLGRRPTRTGP